MKSNIFFVSLTIFLTILVLTCSLNIINFAKADVVFSDNFQSGNINLWTQFTGALTINSQTTNNGEPYSVQSTVSISLPPASPDPNANLYCHILPSVTNPMDIREYVHINSTAVPSTNGDYYQVGGFASNTRPDYGAGELIVTNVGGTLYWGIFYREATGSANPSGFDRQISTSNSTSTAVKVQTGWTCIELRQWIAASGQSNGEEQFYVNGQLIIDATNVVNGDRTPYYVIIGGSQAVTKTSETWTYYIADVVVSSNYIGLNQNLLTSCSNFGTVTPGNSSFGQGQPVTITAIPPTTVSGVQYVWQGWTGTGTGSYTGLGTQSGSNYTASITMNSNITETASWSVQYELIVSSNYGAAIGNLTWYIAGSTAYAAITPTKVGGATGTQYLFTGWSGDASGAASTSNAIIMDGPKTVVAQWKTQYLVTFTQSGLGSDASGTFVTVNGAAYGLSDLPASVWVDASTGSVTYSYTGAVSGSSGVQYVKTSIDASPVTGLSGPLTVTGAYKTQYLVTFTQSGLGSDASGTFVTVNGAAYGLSDLPASVWVDASTGSVTYSYTGAVSGSSGVQYVKTSIDASPVTGLSGPLTVTGAYKTQYYLMVSSKYDSPSPTSGWFNSNTNITAYVSSPDSGYTCSGWVGTGSVPGSGGSSVVTFTITSPSTLTWSWVSLTASPTSTPSSIPTSAPANKSTPTASPSSSPKPTLSPTHSPVTSPSSSPQPISNSYSRNVPYLLVGGIVVIVGALVAVHVLHKRRTKA